MPKNSFFQAAKPIPMQITPKMKYAHRYSFINFLEVCITINAAEDKNIRHILTDCYQEYTYQVDYNFLSEQVCCDENNFGEYNKKITLLINESGFELIKDMPFIKEYQILKTIEMAQVKLLELSTDNYSSFLKKITTEKNPYIVLKRHQIYDYSDSRAAHNGHPCGYITFVPLPLIQQYEAIIEPCQKLITKVRTIDFEISLDKTKGDDYQLSEILNSSIKRKRKDQANQEIILCEVPIDQAVMMFYAESITANLKISCPSEPDFGSKVILTKLVEHDKNEQQAIQFLKDNPVDLVNYLPPRGSNVRHAIHMAAEKGMIDLLQTLLASNQGINIDIPYINIDDNYGPAGAAPSALQLAIFAPAEKMLPTLKLLVTAGANINYLNADNQSIVDLIISRLRDIQDSETKCHFKEVIAYLLENGVNESDEQRQQLDVLIEDVRYQCTP